MFINLRVKRETAKLQYYYAVMYVCTRVINVLGKIFKFIEKKKRGTGEEPRRTWGALCLRRREGAISPTKKKKKRGKSEKLAVEK